MNTRVPFTFNLMKIQKVHEHVVYICVHKLKLTFERKHQTFITT